MVDTGSFENIVTHLTLLLSVSNKPIKDNRLTPVRSYPAVNYLTHSWGFFLKITGKLLELFHMTVCQYQTLLI